MQKLGFTASKPLINIILPVGISFYTFQAIGLIVDVSRKRITTKFSLLDTSFFISFFPQLVAGPIVRAESFMPQIKEHHNLNSIPIRQISTLFIGGFVKKAVIADNFGFMFVDPVFSNPGEYASLAIIFSVFAYAVQIYCDFSGYTDMAIAISRSFGFKLPKNFKAPYFSSTITEFWRRWHISLSGWLRDYLYITLGGNRKGKRRTYVNLIITMVLGGLWHGASWNFLVWGYMHGSLLAFERLTNWKAIVSKNKIFTLFGVFITFYLTCIMWVFFRSSNFQESIYIVSVMAGFKAGGANEIPVFYWLIFFALASVHYVVQHYSIYKMINSIPIYIYSAVFGVFIAIILPFIPHESQPFIYFQF